MRLGLALLLLPALAASARAASVEYALSYLGLPGRVDWAQRTLPNPPPAPAPPPDAQQTQSLSLGAAGVRIALALPHEVGPFQAGVETGLVLPVGGQTFQRGDLVTNTAGKPKNDTNEGDYDSWHVTALPILATLRYAVPSQVVSLGGQVGAGPVVLGLRTDAAEATYDNADVLIRSETTTTNGSALSFAVEAEAGLVIPATEELTLKLYGGLLWLAQTGWSTTRASPAPVMTYGPGGSGEPGLQLGGLGFTLRLGLTYGI